MKPATSPPEIFISFAAASAVPPVAIKSSIINTLSPLFIESLCTSIVAFPYSNSNLQNVSQLEVYFFFLRAQKVFLIYKIQ